MRRAIALASFLAPVLLAPAAQAGPWAVGKGHFYAKLSFQHLRSTELAQPDGTLFDIPTFTRTEGSFYAQVGLTDRVDFYTSVPLVRSADLADQPDELGRETGFGDLQVGLQAQFARRGNWVFAVRGTVQIPTGDETRGEGLLPTGSGAWEGEGLFGAGLSFARGKGYGYVEVGHQYRGSGLRDTFLYNVQVGWNVGPRVTFAWNLRGVEPWTQEPGARTAGSFVGVGDRTTYSVSGPTAIVKFARHWGLQLDYDVAFHARNLAKGPTFRGGISFQR
ncbi:MAG TPA: hypothetical protein VLI67_11985 [Vicinamibacteria bacterium]|nr:hypothetical protein [Vicinamibacteria bacterium]